MENNRTTVKVVEKGITFGSCLAMILSFSIHHSVLWAIFHGLLSWLYVIFYVIRHGF